MINKYSIDVNGFIDARAIYTIQVRFITPFRGNTCAMDMAQLSDIEGKISKATDFEDKHKLIRLQKKWVRVASPGRHKNSDMVNRREILCQYKGLGI